MNTLLLVDIQNDFLPGGALAVPGGDEIVPVVNELMNQFDLVVATQDWHPRDHVSFLTNHAGHKMFDQIDADGLKQVLWPEHCVEWTGGAMFASGLDTRRIDQVFPKGTDNRIDSYSGFFDNGRRHSTGLGDWLRARGVGNLTVGGLATDYCVKFTVLDALAEGFQVTVRMDACRGVELNDGDIGRAVEEMRENGATIPGRST